MWIQKFRILIISLFIISCSQSKGDTESIQEENTIKSSVNITILLDLSDRIIRDINSSQQIRDIAIVNEFVRYIKKNMEDQGAFNAKDKFQIIFNPLPEDPNVNAISRDLSIDLEDLEPKEKKIIYDSIGDTFESNLKSIYESTLKTKNWIGSDVWRFFKNDIKDLVISDNEDYRNILVVVTDGYLYHSDSARREGNKTSYVTNTYLKNIGIYEKADWREYLNDNEFGLLPIEDSYEDLEVLFLEINPIQSYLVDEDITRWFIGNWLEEMGITNFRIYNTDVTTNTAKRIARFMKN
ncbi:MAG: hypothetical protein WD016_10930 [Balneolaceae bacterium]